MMSSRPPSILSARKRALAVALFFLSGASGLVYQVIWVRQFGKVFGNTLHSAALVTSIFLGGLGVGALVAGRWIDRGGRGDPARALRAYAACELAIAARATAGPPVTTSKLIPRC